MPPYGTGARGASTATCRHSVPKGMMARNSCVHDPFMHAAAGAGHSRGVLQLLSAGLLRSVWQLSTLPWPLKVAPHNKSGNTTLMLYCICRLRQKRLMT